MLTANTTDGSGSDAKTFAFSLAPQPRPFHLSLLSNKFPKISYHKSTSTLPNPLVRSSWIRIYRQHTIDRMAGQGRPKGSKNVQEFLPRARCEANVTSERFIGASPFDIPLETRQPLSDLCRYVILVDVEKWVLIFQKALTRPVFTTGGRGRPKVSTSRATKAATTTSRRRGRPSGSTNLVNSPVTPGRGRPKGSTSRVTKAPTTPGRRHQVNRVTKNVASPGRGRPKGSINKPKPSGRPPKIAKK